MYSPRHLCDREKKEGKEKTQTPFLHIVAVFVLTAVFLTTLGLSAHALFSYSLQTKVGVIGAGNFFVEVSAAEKGSDVLPALQMDGTMHTLTLYPNRTYTIVLSASDSTAQTGFCIITADGCDKRYHTRALQPQDQQAATLAFDLSVTRSTEVQIIAHWGSVESYSLYEDDTERAGACIKDGQKITLSIDATAETSAPISADGANATATRMALDVKSDLAAS